MLRKINRKIKSAKFNLLNLTQHYLHPEFYNELLQSHDDIYGSYKIHDDDLPVLRDLKSFLNMLAAVERMTESYSLIAVSLFKCLEIPADLLDFYRNYKVYASTNSQITNYLKQGRLKFKEDIYPKIKHYFFLFLGFFNAENLERYAEIIIEQIISLEQYQQKYITQKRLRQKDKYIEERIEQNEGFFTTLVKKDDYILRHLYKTNFEKNFLPPPDIKLLNANETKANDSNNGNLKSVAESKSSQEKSLEYYFENEKDNDTLKNIKKLTNGIIAIKKVLDDYAAYKTSGMLSSFSCGASFIINLRKAYICFQTFDYQALIAEQTSPLTEYIKALLAVFAFKLENLCCLLDDIESEKGLKEGLLLHRISNIIYPYYQIAYEVKLNIDYSSQKNLFFKARLTARRKFINSIATETKELDKLLKFKHHPLPNIPISVITHLKNYLDKYHDDIAMDRTQLQIYRENLQKLLNGKYPENFSHIFKQYITNQLGFSIHAKLMKSLKNRKSYLTKLNRFLKDRLIKMNNTDLIGAKYNYQKSLEIIEESLPFPDSIKNIVTEYADYRSLEIISEMIPISPVLKGLVADYTGKRSFSGNTTIAFNIVVFSLNNRIEELDKQKIDLCMRHTESDANRKNAINDGTIPHETKKVDELKTGNQSTIKTPSLEMKPSLVKNTKGKKKAPSDRIINQITSIIKELGFFKKAVDKITVDADLKLIVNEIKPQDDCLTAESTILIDELNEIIDNEYVRNSQSIFKS